MLGDLNDFEFSDTLTILKGGGAERPDRHAAAAERYTYVFEGNSQALDHILVSNRSSRAPSSTTWCT